MKTRLLTRLLLLVFVWALLGLGEHVQSQGIHRVSLPSTNWALEISLAGFDVPTEEITSDGHNYRLDAVVRKFNGQVDAFSGLEIRMYPSQSHGDAVNMRDFLVKKLEKNRDAKTGSILRGKIRTFEYNGIPVSQYESEHGLAPNLPLRIPQRSIEAYFVKDDVWIMIRLATAADSGDHGKLFQSVLDSVRIVDTPDNPTNSLDYYQRGRSFFLQKKYLAAVDPLSTALKLEQRQRTLGIAYWRELVQYLTASYAATGNVNEAKETLAYGISEDPNNPMFHLGLARLYAILGDLDSTIASLEKAFMYRANYKDSWGHVKSLPDPMFDEQFEQFKKIDKFRKAVKAMKK